ncbi:hypothetical protein COK19_06395 [Bacillus cereus]|uniref:UPF0715 family protein n=1 Tax=Bacillus cereus TaxID=1396 RepID=UPI000BF83C8A|nr:UPF0715 family protein [Bacillus cereus]PFR29318.1 hypothetical protein COK19_06395 [Bacillus cereus]
MFLQRLKVILLSGLCMSLVSIIAESPGPLSEANLGLLSIYTPAYSFAFTIFAVPIQLLLFKTKHIKPFSIFNLLIYIVGALITYQLISMSDFHYDGLVFMNPIIIIYIVSAGLFFWLWDSLIILNKKQDNFQ